MLDSEILGLLQRLLANRAGRDLESISIDTLLVDLLPSDDDWIAVQRGIHRNLACVIPLARLKALRTVNDLLKEAAIELTRLSRAAPQGEEPDQFQPDGTIHHGYRTVAVFYATDRAMASPIGLVQQYGPGRGDGTLSLGLAEVAIPHSHKFGELEGAPWWQFFRSPDPNKHIMVIRAGALTEQVFWKDVQTCVASSGERDILLLIHGYNVTFDQGLRRAAQVVDDLKFLGAPILYSWPSEGRVGSYSADENNVEWTVPRLKTLLRQLLEGAGATQIHVIAHSLGSRAAIAAIRELQVDTLAPRAAQLNQFVLAAPDIDAGTFRQLAAEFSRKSKRCTLYANTEDRALAASDWKHGGYARAGGGSDDLVVVSNIETIDATGMTTDFLSHSYYAAASPVVSDLFHVIRSARPDARMRLKRHQLGELSYWRFA